MEPKPPVIPITDGPQVIPEFETEGFLVEANGIIEQFNDVIQRARETHELNGNTDQFRDLLIGQVFNPIGRDVHVSRSALGFINYAVRDPSLFKDLNEIREERASLENPSRGLPEVIVAITHGVNYIKIIFEGKEDYIIQDGLDSYEEWTKVYEDIANNESKRRIYRENLLKKDIVTTDPMRAVGIHAVTNMIFGGQRVNWVDMGCSANWSLVRASSPEAAMRDPYVLVDKTHYAGKDGVILDAANEPVNLGIGMGIDKSNPYQDPQWFLSCGHLKDINSEALAEKGRRMKAYRATGNVILLAQHDMRDPHVDAGKWNIVSALTSAYLIPNGEGQRDEMFEKWEELLTEDGIIAIQDYLNVNQDGRLEIVDERQKNGYALAIKGKVTGGKWMVVLRYKDSYCSEISNGEDFGEFMDNVSHWRQE